MTCTSSLYSLFRCNTTDPGVIPAIKSGSINPKKDYCKRKLRIHVVDVEYKEQGVRNQEEGRLETPKEFFDTNKFRLVNIEEEAATMSGGEK